MDNSDEKIDFISLFMGLFVIFIIMYIIYAILIVPNPQYIISFYIMGGIIVASLILIIYYCFKNVEFREKTLKVVHKLTLGLSRWGSDIIRNMMEGDKKSRKKRVPISPQKQKRLFDRAEDRCQYCGKGDVKLHIHHINGNPADNGMNNLIVLCPNHHSIANSLNVNVLKSDAKKAYRVKTTTQKVD